MVKRLNDPVTLEKIKKDMTVNLAHMNGAHALLFRQDGPTEPWTRKISGSRWPRRWKVTPIDAAVRIILQTENAPMVGFVADEHGRRRQLHEAALDGDEFGRRRRPSARMGAPSPRKYRDYVLNKKVISLPFFIRSSTGLTADIIGLKDRGYLKSGYFADVVVFDPKTYGPKNDYLHWNTPSVGVMDLFVNGKAAVDDGKVTTALSGRPLPHTPTAGSCNGAI